MNNRHRTQIIVSVDTEEEGLWGGSYRVHHNTTENLKGLPRFQECCNSLGVSPTYLIDAPVLHNKIAITQLKNWWDSGMCEVGAHCHPWCNPPFTEQVINGHTSYLCNLPQDLQHEKLKWLTQRICDAFDRQPLSYRAGRYGFDQTSAEILSELGYFVDSSVLPAFDYRSQGGPDFSFAQLNPHRLTSQLWEAPITAGFTRGDHNNQIRLWQKLRAKPYTSVKLAGIADRLNWCRRVKLSPEGYNLTSLKQLVDNCINNGNTTLVLMLHSSSLAAGFSPYARTSEMLENLYTTLTGIVAYTIEKYLAKPSTLSDAVLQ